MKRKIEYIIISAALILGAFFIEKNMIKTETEKAVHAEMQNMQSRIQSETQTENANDWAQEYCTSDIAITDWNTDGKELVFMLSNGTELYASKSENVYSPERKQYISFDDISDIEKDEKGNIIIYSKDGDTYTVTVNAN